MDVNPGVSIDDEGKERFHPLNLMGHYNGEFPDWLYSYATNRVQSVNILKIIAQYNNK